jgi:hypothetical protein
MTRQRSTEPSLEPSPGAADKTSARPPGPPWHATQVLALQRSAGNAAVARLAAGLPRWREERYVPYEIVPREPANHPEALGGAGLDALLRLYTTNDRIHQLSPGEGFGLSWIRSSAGSGLIRQAIRTKLRASVDRPELRAPLLQQISALPGAPERKRDLELMVQDVFESPSWRAGEPIAINPAWSSRKQRCARLWNEKGTLLAQLAAGLDPGIEPFVIGGIMAAETGHQFFEAGRLVVRFEAHVFWKLWGKSSAQRTQRFHQHFQASKPHKWRREPQGQFQPYHNDQDREWEVLEFARGLDDLADTDALRSTSFGAGQTLGRNFARVGYSSVHEMVQHYQARERAQVEGIVEFIRTIPAPSRAAVIAAIKQGDFLPLSTKYGPRNPEAHAARIAAHVDAMREVVTAGN